tara:strand:- start:903 stop:1871 length:969 start_codon:yes stop_codon:yes gene_type:complete
MLRMPEFSYVHPKTAQEAVDLMFSTENAHYVAGGTDLLPNIKNGLHEPSLLIGLGGLPKPTVTLDGGVISIDGGMKLSALASNSLVKASAPSLAEACSLIAGPQIRNMGTIAGNVMLDTRCIYFNQTEFWREALGFCLKKSGEWCHVINSPKSCVATQSSDTVPVLMAKNASLVFLGRDGERRMNIRDLFQFKGEDHLKLEKGELLVRIEVPVSAEGTESCYRKVRPRGSIDFPQLGVAIVAQIAETKIEKLVICVGAISPTPKMIKGLDAFCGETLSDEVIEKIAAIAKKQCRPQGAVAGGEKWRREMVAVEVEVGLAGLR